MPPWNDANACDCICTCLTLVMRCCQGESQRLWLAGMEKGQRSHGVSRQVVRAGMRVPHIMHCTVAWERLNKNW